MSRSKEKKNPLKAQESEVQHACHQFLALLRNSGLLWYVRNNTFEGEVNGAYIKNNTEPGAPDDLVCYKGHFIGIEYKRPGGKPRADQMLCHERIQKAGGKVWVIDNVADLQAHFREFDLELKIKSL